jgi:Ca2+-binding RTX toxin-like protein
MRRYSLVSLVAAALIATNVSPAGASVTIGQTDPSSTPMASCAGVTAQDMAQPSVTSGNSYVVPADGTITSWSHNAVSGANQNVTMKVWRLISGMTYLVIGHDGPRTFSGPGLIRFSGISVPVQRGDVLGLNAGTGGFVDCMFPAPGDTMLYANPSDTPDGQTTTFTTVPDRRPNISAVVEPDCDQDGLGDETQDTDTAFCRTAAGAAALTCRGAQATIIGTSGNDVRSGTPARDVMVGLAGNDTFSGLGGNDLICGAAGNDRLNGGKGKDTLSGQKGNDKLKGAGGNDKLSGKKGKDALKGDGGKDNLKGGGGRDLCEGDKGNDTASKCEVEKSI